MVSPRIAFPEHPCINARHQNKQLAVSAERAYYD